MRGRVLDARDPLPQAQACDAFSHVVALAVSVMFALGFYTIVPSMI